MASITEASANTSTTPKTAETTTTATPSNTKDLIEKFYYRGWNRRDENAILECLHDDVKFRNALSARGKKDRGPQAFLEYVRQLMAVVQNFTIKLDDLVVEEGKKAAVRCTSRGIHRGTFFGVAASGYEVTWTSMAFVTVLNGKIVEIWVLGDVDSLKNQIGAEKNARAFST